MKKTKQNLHEECEKCENLKTISVYMDGSAYYTCGRTPNHVEKERHKSPCHRFVLYEEEMKNETDYYST